MDNKNAEQKKPLTRFGEFDLLKALAIMGLPAVHVMEEALEGNFSSPGLVKFSYMVIGLCTFGPSVFMICMGFGISGGRTKHDAVLRNGIQFLLIGAILNILRWFLPGIIQSALIDKNLLNDLDFCLMSDIYYFVGIYYIFYAFMLKIGVKTPGLIMISILMLTANMLLTPVMHDLIKDPTLSALVGNYIYVDETSCFPLLSWAIFPSVGILLGDILKKSDEEKRANIMKRTMDFSAVLFISFVSFLWVYKIDIMKALVSPANEYITDLPNVILLISLALFLISLAYYLCKHIGSSSFMEFILRISAFIIPFYMLQWIIIAWLFYGLEIAHMKPGSFNLIMYLVSVIIITFICIIVTINHGMKMMKTLLKITNVKKKKKKKNKKNKKIEGKEV